uniref:Uncharacterized protein n=1 Tax=Anguilla anguilla TaxID=7936 RepID=A0A0E9WVC7_ANGAN
MQGKVISETYGKTTILLGLKGRQNTRSQDPYWRLFYSVGSMVLFATVWHVVYSARFNKKHVQYSSI